MIANLPWVLLLRRPAGCSLGAADRMFLGAQRLSVDQQYCDRPPPASRSIDFPNTPDSGQNKKSPTPAYRRRLRLSDASGAPLWGAARMLLAGLRLATASRPSPTPSSMSSRAGRRRLGL